MNNIYDILETCLQSLENGVDVEHILTQYPQFANELRPILKASAQARKLAAAEPSLEAHRRGRAKLLQRTAQLREAKAPAHRRVMPFFQRLAYSLSITSVLLLSGTGLVGASSNALPGENLYPVKRSWEGVQLLFVFNHGHREALESGFENERLHEVSELLTEGKQEMIRFSGILMNVNGITYISGIRVAINAGTKLPVEILQTGVAVTVTGHTDATGVVEAEVIELAPAGSIVPVGKHVNNSDVGNPTPAPGPASGGASATPSAGGTDVNHQPDLEQDSYQVEGKVNSINGNTIVIDGRTIYIDQAGFKSDFVVGAKVKVEGYFTKNGQFVVTKVEVEEPETKENESKDKNDNEDGGNASGGEDDGSNDGHDDSDQQDDSED